MPFEPTTTAEFLTNSSIMQKLLEQRAAQQSIEQTRQLRASPEQAQRIFQDTLRSNQAHVEALQADAAAKIAETNRARRGVGAAPTPSQVGISRAPAVAPTPAPVSRGITHSFDRAVGAIRNRLPNAATAVAAVSTANTVASYAAGQKFLNDLGAGLGIGGVGRNAKRALDLIRKNKDPAKPQTPIPQINSPTTTSQVPADFTGGQGGVKYNVSFQREGPSGTGVGGVCVGSQTGAGTSLLWGPIGGSRLAGSNTCPNGPSPAYGLAQVLCHGLGSDGRSTTQVWVTVLGGSFRSFAITGIARQDGLPDTDGNLMVPGEVPTPTPPISPEQLPSFPEAIPNNLPASPYIPITQQPPVPSAQPTTAPLPVSDPAPDTGATPESDATPQNVPPSTQTVLDTPTAKVTVEKDGNTTTTTTRLYGAAALAAATAVGAGIATIITAKPKDATSVTPIIPPGAPPPTTTPTRCPCNGPVLDKLDTLSAGLDAADLALLGLIKADTGKIRTGTGVDLFPADIPAHLNGKSGAVRNVTNLADQNLWMVEALDSVLGAYPNKTSVTAPNGALSELLGDTIADDLAEIKGMLMGLTIDSAEILHTATRTLAQSGSATQQAHLAQRYAKANAEFLGYEGRPKAVDMPLTYTPGGNPFQNLLSESTTKIQGWENTDKQDLKGILYELLHAAAIIRALYWRKLDPKADIQAQLKTHVQSQSAGIDAIGDNEAASDWPAYLERVEQGFNAQTGDQTPYGRDQSERPKIRDVGGENAP